MSSGGRPHSRWRGAGALLLLALVAVLAALAGRQSSGGPASQKPPGPPATPDRSPLELGVNVNRVFEDPHLSSQAITQLAALQATGAGLARTDTLWGVTEPQAPVGGHHRYDWVADDLIAFALASHGLRWLPVVDYSAGWAESVAGQDHSPPASDADYAAFAAAFAARYGPGGTFWRAHPTLTALPVQAMEIWNEPDNPAFWVPSPDPARYAGLYATTRAAVLAAQPAMRVLVGGLWHPGAFLEAMLRARPDLVGHIDGVAIHPYGATPGQIVTRVRAARALLERLGLGAVPLYVTEVGWTTSPPGSLDYLPARLRPGYLTQTLVGLGHLACGVAAVVVYTWVTAESNPADSQQWFGIHPPGGGSSTDTTAFASGLRGATAPGATIPCTAP